jgi:transposase-like protein
MPRAGLRRARALLAKPDNTIASIARLLGVSRSTIYKYVPELSTNRALEPGSGPQPALHLTARLYAPDNR